MFRVKPSRVERRKVALRSCFADARILQQVPRKRGGKLVFLVMSLAFVLALSFCRVTAIQAQPLTPPQQAVLNTINVACPPLAMRIQTLTGAVADLAARCTEVALQQTDPGAVRNPLLQMAPEEVPAQGTTSVEFSRVVPPTIAARLSALLPTRRRAATGGGFPEVSLNINGHTLSDALVSLSPSGESIAAARTNSPPTSPRLGVFLNGTFTVGDKDATSREAGFDFDALGLTAGLDYWLINNLIVGAAFSYISTEADINSSGGDVDTDRYIGSIYGLYYIGDKFYINGIANIGGNTYDMRRNINYQTTALALGPTGPTLVSGTTTTVNQTAKSDTDGMEYSFGLGAGYDFHIRGFTVGPTFRLNYINAHIDGYQETINNENPGFGLNLAFKNQDVDSFTTALGVQATYALSTRWAVVVPQLLVEWEHEFLNDSRTIGARFVNDPMNIPLVLVTEDPDRDFVNVGAGLSAVFPRGKSAFLYYETVLGLKDITAHNIVAGIRLSF